MCRPRMLLSMLASGEVDQERLTAEVAQRAAAENAAAEHADVEAQDSKIIR